MSRVEEGGARTLEDEEFLDECFERMVDQLQEGAPLRVEEWATGREHLLEELNQLTETARQVVSSRARPRLEIPGYRVERELGRGSMGTVYLAHQERLGGRRVAIKVLPHAYSMSPRARSRFRAEARILGSLKHPNIVSVYDIVEEGSLDAYVMEWVEGESLASLLHALDASSEERLVGAARRLGACTPASLAPSWTRYVAKLGAQLARALSEVHVRGILHRDVKPSNILLRRDGIPLLSDFGLARRPNSSFATRTGGFLGTPAFAAPEQLAGEPLDERADVYSLAATLVDALVRDGRERAPSSWEERVGSLSKRLPRELAKVLDKATSGDRSLRYSSAAEFADDLERFERNEPVLARPPSLAWRAWKAAQRHRGAVLACLGTTLLLLAGLAWSGWRARLQERDARRAQELREQAQLLLLSEDVSAWVIELAHSSAVGGRSELARPSREAIQQIRSLYGRALELEDEDAGTRARHSVVALALESWGEPHGKPLDAGSLPEELPWTRRLANASDMQAWAEDLDEVQLSAASSLDRLSAGLLAYLRGEPEIALRFWQGREPGVEADAVADGVLGMLFLSQRDSFRALLWLNEALAAVPEARGLRSRRARAYVYSELYASARRDLETIEAQRAGVELSPLERDAVEHVRALLLEAEGRGELALSRLKAVADRRRSPSVLRDYARMAESHGLWAEAMQARTRLCEHHPSKLTFALELLGLAEDWWAGLGQGRRADCLVGLMNGEGLAGLHAAEVRTRLRLAQAALENVDKSATLDGTTSSGAGPTGSDLLRALTPLEVLMNSRISLDALGARQQRAIASLWLAPKFTARQLWIPALLATAATQLSAQTKVYELVGEDAQGRAGTSLCTLGDVDGDGYDDFAYGSDRWDAPGQVDAGAVTVVSGRCGIAMYEVPGSVAGGNLGASVALVGDLDGDSVGDFLAGAPDYAGSTPGRAAVYSGASGAPLAAHSHVGGASGDRFGMSVAAAGDLDLDGVPDYLVGADQRAIGGKGRMHAYSGATGLLLFTRDGLANGDSFGISLAGLDDLDGDGRPEFAVGAQQPGDSDPGYVLLLRWSGASTSVLETYRDTTAPNWTAFGLSVSAMSDVDGDGKRDLLIGDPGFGESTDSGRVYCFSTQGPTYPNLWQSGSLGTSDGYGVRVISLGYDLDDDGVNDVAASAHEIFFSVANGPGYVRFLSAMSGASLDTVYGEQTGDRFGERIAELGDLNGDGLPELGIASQLTTVASADLPGRILARSPLSHPLSTDTHVISMSTGGTQTLMVDAPSQPGALYLCLGSLSGESPGLPLGAGLLLPLNVDPLTILGLASANSAPYGANLGLLSGTGQAQATFTLPAGASGSLPLPAKLFHACLFLEPVTGAVTQISAAVPLSLVP